MASRTFTDYRQAGSSLDSSSSGDESDSEIAETLSRRGSNEAFDNESEGYSSGSDSIEAVVDRMGNMHVWTREELEQKTVAALKEVMKERNLPTGGNKTDLINRLLGLEPENETDLSKCAVARLRAMLKARNLPTGGKKEELIRRIEGTEHVEEGTYAYFDRYTNKELVEKLKAQERDAGGTKKDLINRLLGNEPSMPPEGWANSKDREMLFEALRKVEQSSLRFKTAEEAYSIQPYNRWPWYRFKGYFKDALVSVLKEETIARQDNRDFENLLKTNPRPKWTSRGVYIISIFTFWITIYDKYLTVFSLKANLIGAITWQKTCLSEICSMLWSMILLLS